MPDSRSPIGRRPVQVSAHHGMTDDPGGLAEVPVRHGRERVLREHRPGVAEHHRIVVHVDHAGGRVDALGDLMHVLRGWQPGADVKQLPDPGVPHQVADHPAEQCPLPAHARLDSRHRSGDPLAVDPVDGEVVLAAKQVVVDPRHIGPRRHHAGGGSLGPFPHKADRSQSHWVITGALRHHVFIFQGPPSASGPTAQAGDGASSDLSGGGARGRERGAVQPCGQEPRAERVARARRVAHRGRHGGDPPWRRIARRVHGAVRAELDHDGAVVAGEGRPPSRPDRPPGAGSRRSARPPRPRWESRPRRPWSSRGTRPARSRARRGTPPEPGSIVTGTPLRPASASSPRTTARGPGSKKE